jgi:hypothetical protein
MKIGYTGLKRAGRARNDRGGLLMKFMNRASLAFLAVEDE